MLNKIFFVNIQICTDTGFLSHSIFVAQSEVLSLCVAFTKYLHGTGTLAAPEAGDMDQDGVLDVFDLGLLKRAYLNK